MPLRPYQDTAVSELRSNVAAGYLRQILVAPTGSGKTVMASSIISQAISRGRRCLFLAHRKELIDQASKKLDMFGVDHGVIKAGHKRVQPWSKAQVASAQTLVRRDHYEADIVIIDECHISTAATYQEILGRFSRPPIIIGLTATPYRQGGVPLGDMYQKLVVSTSARVLVQQGHLVNPTVYAGSNIDWRSLTVKRNGEFTNQSASNAMADVLLRGEIVDNWQSKCPGAATVVFAQNIEHSKTIADQFNKKGIPAAHLDGKTSDKKRERILADLASRKIQVVSNCNVLSEGYDLPLLESVVLARPIFSKGIYKQMGGRVMRPSPEKRMAVIMDHGSNTARHGFLTDPEAYSLDEDFDVSSSSRSVDVADMPVVCPACNAWIPAGHAQCPVCGGQLEEFVTAETIESLVEVDNDVPTTLFENNPPAYKSAVQTYYENLCETCVRKNYRPGWVAYRFKDRWKKWPGSQISKPKYFSDYEKRRNAEAQENTYENGTATRSRSSATIPPDAGRSGPEPEWEF